MSTVPCTKVLSIYFRFWFFLYLSTDLDARPDFAGGGPGANIEDGSSL